MSRATIRETGADVLGQRTCKVEVRDATGVPGAPGKSAYELARDAGFGGTYQQWAQTLVGPSAYDEAVSLGFEGTIEDWLASLVGPQGPQGEIGEQGPAGDTGPQGECGPSAYDVARQYGFEGTVEEWLESLKGERGETGPAGPEGPQGPQGPQGLQGPQGEGADPAELAALREGVEAAQATADAAQDTADTATYGLAEKVDTATYEAGQAAQDEAASALDARVTALEAGGGGGDAFVKKVSDDAQTAGNTLTSVNANRVGQAQWELVSGDVSRIMARQDSGESGTMGAGFVVRDDASVVRVFNGPGVDNKTGRIELRVYQDDAVLELVQTQGTESKTIQIDAKTARLAVIISGIGGSYTKRVSLSELADLPDRVAALEAKVG